MMKARKLLGYTLILSLLVVFGCAKKEEEVTQEVAPAPQGQAPPLEQAGTVTGKVSLEGQPPQPVKIQMAADPACVKLHTEPVYSEQVVVNDNGTLRNVFVYVKEGAEKWSFPTPKDPVIIDQKGCQYTPHVFGIQVNQPLKILNSDPLLHNIHAWAQKNKPFNIGMPPTLKEIERKFTQPEVMIPIKCDVHKWMAAYVGVLAHPYYSVTGADGTFAIKSLPPGEYTIEAWHEKYGTQTQKITLGPKETKEISFTFKAEVAG